MSEWTPEKLREIRKNSPYGDIAICDAHNIELAAERESKWGGTKWYDKARQLERQLLQTQAAIAEHNKSPEVTHGLCPKITVDLSALDKHDAEVRKPLLDALEQIRDMSWHQVGKAAIYIADAALQAAALAKVKEGK